MITDVDIDLHIAMANDETPYAVINGRIVPSGIGMRKANEWARRFGILEPYPQLGMLRVTT